MCRGSLGVPSGSLQYLWRNEEVDGGDGEHRQLERSVTDKKERDRDDDRSRHRGEPPAEE